jgi:hypothetical protein
VNRIRLIWWALNGSELFQTLDDLAKHKIHGAIVFVEHRNGTKLIVRCERLNPPEAEP